MDALIREIRTQQQLSASLEPSAELRKKWLSSLMHYTETFFATLNDGPAVQHGIPVFDSTFTSIDKPISMDEVLHVFQKNVINFGANPTSPRFLAYIPAGGIFTGALGDYLAALTNRYSATYALSPGAVEMEAVLINWMKDLIGFPAGSSGNLTSGGSMANLIALVTAREAKKIRAKDIERVVIYLSEYTHHSVKKSIRTIGMGEAILRFVPVDANFRVDVGALEQIIRSDQNQNLLPFLVIANGGTTDLGSVDPIDEMAQIAAKYHLWLHVDAAYGGFFQLTTQGKKKLKGIDEADSITLDPHKGLFLPYGIGAVLIKNSELHHQAFTSSAAYMQDTKLPENLSPADLSPELTKHFRALRFWISMKLLGVEPFRAALTEKLLLAQYFYQHLKTIPNIEILSPPQLSIVTFRSIRSQHPNHDNKEIHNKLCADGKVLLSSTMVKTHYYIRMAVLNFRTHLEEVDLVLERLKALLL